MLSQRNDQEDKTKKEKDETCNPVKTTVQPLQKAASIAVVPPRRRSLFLPQRAQSESDLPRIASHTTSNANTQTISSSSLIKTIILISLYAELSPELTLGLLVLAILLGIRQNTLLRLQQIHQKITNACTLYNQNGTGIEIEIEHMSELDPKKMNDTDEFYIGFGRKIAFANLPLIPYLSLTHSAIVLVKKNDMDAIIKMSAEEQKMYFAQHKPFLIIGRQSPLFKTKSSIGLFPGLVSNLFRKRSLPETKMTNEKKYTALGNAPFTVSILSDIQYSGKAIKEILLETDKEIAKLQACTMYRSNCYSASIYALCAVIVHLHQNNLPQETKKQAIASVADLMLDMAQQNKGEGVVDNQKVCEKILDVISICGEYDLVSAQDVKDIRIALGVPERKMANVQSHPFT